MKTLSRKYSIWRMIGAYFRVLARDADPFLGSFFLVAVFAVAFSYFWNAVHFGDPLARTGYFLGITIVRWIPVTPFVAMACRKFLQLPAAHHETVEPSVGTLAVVTIVAAILQGLVSLAVASTRPSLGKTVLGVPFIYFLHAWFALAIMHLQIGWAPAPAMGEALRFIAVNFSKIFAYLLVVVLAVVLLLLVFLVLVPRFFGQVSWGTPLLGFIALLLPAFLCPVAPMIYTKVTFFPDPPKVDMLK